MKQIKKIFNSLPAIFLILLCFTPVIWSQVKPGAIINGSDTNFPLDPVMWFTRRFYVWNPASVNTGFAFSSSVSGLFFHFTQLVPYLFGLSLQMTQLLSILFWFTLIIFSSFTFAKTIFPQKKLSQLTFVIFYAFNIYLFNTWENIKVANLALISSIPLGLSLLILLKNKKITFTKAAFLSSLLGIILSGSGINPAYFFTFFLCLAIFQLSVILTDIHSFFKRTKEILFISTIIGFINLYWILPTINFILNTIGSAGGINKIGYTNWIDSLSENTSLFNIMRMQGAWDWYATDATTNLPIYIPYAVNYFFNPPFLIFSILIPSLILLSLIFRRKNKSHLYLSFTIMFIFGVFMGAGTHKPTGLIYEYFSKRIPIFTFFRSPWYIFTPLVVVSAAGLLALFVSRIQKYKLLSTSFILILFVGNFFYTYPLVTGKIYRPAFADNFLIKYPQHVFDAQKWLKENQTGRIIGYPDDSIQKFDWGYNGVDSILGLLSDKEVFTPSLNDPSAPLARIQRELYESLKKDNFNKTYNLAQKLNVNTVFEKKDQESLAPKLPSSITSLPNKVFDKWIFYNLNIPDQSKLYTTNSLFYAYPHTKGEKLLSALDKKQILVNPEDDVVNSISDISKFAGRIILSQNSQAKILEDFKLSPNPTSSRLENYDIGKVDFTFDVQEKGDYQPILERYKIEEFGLSLNGEISATHNGDPLTLSVEKVTDSYLYFSKINLAEGSHTITFNLINNNLINGGDFSEGEQFQKVTYGNSKVSFDIIKDNNGKYLKITNTGETDSMVQFLAQNFDPLTPYFVTLDYMHTYGNSGVILVGQNTKSTLVKTQLESMPNSPQWSSFSFFYEPVKTASELKVSLAAFDVKDPLGTIINYDNLKVHKVFSNNLILVKNSQAPADLPNIIYTKKSPVSYEGEVTNAGYPHLLVFADSYSPNWKLTIIEKDESTVSTKHFSSDLYANAWHINSPSPNYKFKIYYTPQTLMNIGLVISTITFVVIAAFFIHSKLKNDK